MDHIQSMAGEREQALKMMRYIDKANISEDDDQLYDVSIAGGVGAKGKKP